MKKYKVNFTGRENGAIGNKIAFEVIIELKIHSDSDEREVLKAVLYEKYEHISGMTIKEVTT